MAAENTFDIVSKVDLQEVHNAIQNALKEIHTRFDLKDSKSEIAVEGKQDFLQHGGQEFTMIPALNENQEWIHCMQVLIRQQTQLAIKAFPSLQD